MEPASNMCEDSGYGTHSKPLTSSSEDEKAEDVGIVMSPPVRGASLFEERDIFDMLKWAFILRVSELFKKCSKKLPRGTCSQTLKVNLGS